jgi:small subunit ribosomal protein S2
MAVADLIDSLFKAGAHYGYSRSRRHPSVTKYLFGVKGGVELFDLEKTAALMDAAQTFVRSVGADRGTILFVGGKAEAREAIARTAESLNQPYVSGRFIGGALTNWSEIKKRVERLNDLTDKREKGELSMFTKLERLLIDREIDDLTTMFGGLRGMTKLPTAMVVIDPRHEKIAVTEARKMKIPVVALLNSDCDATAVTYPVAANDSTLVSISLFLAQIKAAFEEGLKAAAPVREEASAAAEVAEERVA